MTTNENLLKTIKKIPELFPYQKEGVDLIVNKYKDVLLADHPGAGKTAQVVTAADKLKASKILVICPASLRENWKREFIKWSFRDLKIKCIYNKNDISKLPLENFNVIILSYDLAVKYWRVFQHYESDLLILDESHYLKNKDSLRGRVCLDSFWRNAKKRICITGTPLPNGRALEGYAVFSKLAPKVFGKYRDYLENFCVREDGFWGVNYNKSKNLKRLGEICREHFMIRRDRKETVGQLPALVRFSIPLKVTEVFDDLELMFKFKEAEDEGLRHIEAFKSARRLHGIMKIKPSIDYIKTVLESDKNCVVFAHHKDVVFGLAEGLIQNGITFVSLTGETSSEARQDAIDRFQKGEAQVFLASLLAANTGITLTASSNVIFVEADWVPSNNEQAEARCYRVSQTEVTRSHYLVIPDSLDDAITSSVIRKQKNIIEVLGN